MKLAVLICLFTMAMVMTFPARADTTVQPPVSPHLISSGEARQLCCPASGSNGWCREMTPHPGALQEVYDRLDGPVPAGARPCA